MSNSMNWVHITVYCINICTYIYTHLMRARDRCSFLRMHRMMVEKKSTGSGQFNDSVHGL